MRLNNHFYEAIPQRDDAGDKMADKQAPGVFLDASRLWHVPPLYMARLGVFSLHRRNLRRKESAFYDLMNIDDDITLLDLRIEVVLTETRQSRKQTNWTSTKEFLRS